MTLILNGSSQTVPELDKLSELLDWLNRPASAVLVEKNGESVDRINFSLTKLAEGDKIEIIQMVAGG
jgi:sulfur carrier protein